MSNYTQELKTLIDRYGQDWPLFVREIYGVEPDGFQEELLNWVCQGERRVTIRSGHGVGKSAGLAWVMVCQLLFRYPQNTVVTAPSTSQLWDALWKEFRVWIGKLPPALKDWLEVKADRVELKADPAGSFVSARTSRAEQPDALQGVHCDEGWVLLVCDEASGIPETVFEAASGSMSGKRATTILTGNPVRAQGFFFDTHTKLIDMWRWKRVSCFDSKLVSKDFIEDIRRRYGEHSNAYRIRVLGEFPTSEDDVVIPFDLVEPSLTRDITPVKHIPVIWGVDCARFGSDRSALAKRRGPELLEMVRWWRKKDTMEFAGILKQEFDTTPMEIRPAEINVDVVGIGAGVLDRLRQLGLPARGINVSESPALTNQDRYLRARDELWFKGREWFARRDCKLPKEYARARPEDDLVKELTTPKYAFNQQSNKIKVESKDDMMKRGMDSPDLADAFILTLASDAMNLVHGSYGSTSWRKKLSRQIAGIV